MFTKGGSSKNRLRESFHLLTLSHNTKFNNRLKKEDEF
jgi:hypothetical protein